MEPLNLLREFTSAKRPVTLKDDNLVFDKTAFARKTLTAYRSGLTGTGEFYPLDSLWFLLQQATAPHGQYVAECGKQGIKAVSLPDKRALLAFLQGKTDSSPSIDFANAPAAQPIALPEDASAPTADAMDLELGLDDEAALEADAAEVEEKRKELEESKRQFAALLEQPGPNRPEPAKAAGAAEGEAMDVAAEEEAEGGAAEERPAGKGAAKPAKPRAYALGGAKLFARDKQTTSKTRATLKREQRLRSRKSVLLADSTPNLPLIATILDGFRKRNKATLDAEDQKRRSERMRQSGVGAGSSSHPPSGSKGQHRSGGSGGTRHVVPPTPNHSHGAPAPRGGREQVAVIVVPPTLTSLVNMWTVRELLEDNVLVTAVQKKAAGATKESAITIKHTFEDGSSCSFLVTDNPLKAGGGGNAPIDWNGLVAVFAAGNTWQFKGWPHKDATELFAKVKGYHLQHNDEKPDQLIKTLNVERMQVSKQESKAHEVRVMAMQFWESLHKHMKRAKPHLLVSPPLTRQSSF